MAGTDATPPGAPIACSLGGDQLDQRLVEWRSLLALVTERTEIDRGLRLRFERVPAGQLADLAEREQQCCSFFEFAILIDERGTSLDVQAPANARSIVDELFG